MKLTKAHREALAALNTWQEGRWVSTVNLNADGITTVTLRALFSAGLVDAEKIRSGKYWKITPAGRSALEASE